MLEDNSWRRFARSADHGNDSDTSLIISFAGFVSLPQQICNLKHLTSLDLR